MVKKKSKRNQKRTYRYRDIDLCQFEDNMVKICDLVDEAYQIVCDKLGRDSQAAISANAYWRKQIKSTVAGVGSMETMDDTLEKMRSEYPFTS